MQPVEPQDPEPESVCGRPVDEWFTVFEATVWRELDRLPRDPEAQRLAAAWRALLHLHEARPDGECERCRRGHAGSCTVWQVAVGYFVRRAY